MNIRNTLILLIIFAVLAGYVYFIEVKRQSEKEKIEEQSNKLFSLVKDSISVLDFRNSNGDFVVKKINDEWKIIKPLETGADKVTINSIISILLNATKETHFKVVPAELPQYGLNDRAVIVHVEDNQGERDSLRLGDKTPVGSSVFSNKTDTLVFTVSQNVKSQFEKKLFDIRDKKLLHFKRADVRKITIHNPYGRYVIEKSGVSDWLLKKIDRPADNSKISSILSKLENNLAKAFVDEEGRNMRKYGLSRPAFRVDLQLGPDQGQKRFMISRKIDGKYYAKDDARKPIFEIDSMLVKDINKKLNDFRSKDLASFNRSEVDRITFSYGDTLFSCLKDTSDEWQLDETGGKPLEKSKIQSFFSSLDYTNVTDFVEDGKINQARYGFDHPTLKISLYQGDRLLTEVKLGKIENDKIYAMTNQYDSVYKIGKSKLKDLKLKINDIVVKENKEETQEST